MAAQNKPKERVVFDADSYTEEIWEDLVKHNQAEEIPGWEDADPAQPDMDILQGVMCDDYSDEVTMLATYLAGVDGFEGRENGGNRLIAHGTSSRWDGTSTGFDIVKDIDELLDNSRSQEMLGNIFADCNIDKIWDENGSLFIYGRHHDGAVLVEARQLTDAGEVAAGTIEDSWIGDPFAVNGREYDGSLESVDEAIADLWNDSEMCVPPRYAEVAFGCPAIEFAEDREAVKEADGIDCTALEASARAASKVSETARDDVVAADIAI